VGVCGCVCVGVCACALACVGARIHAWAYTIYTYIQILEVPF